MKQVDLFLEKHKLRASDIDTEKLMADFSGEMMAGLEGRESSLAMIPTYIEAENSFLTDIPALAIDAGGTNFRTALISVSRDGTIETGNVAHHRMPGLEKETSAREFFGIMAGYIRPLAEKSERIGFCFSYPTEIFPDRDGRLIHMTKEIKAPEVVGKRIGKNLLEMLGTPGKKLVLLNDTVATLMAGKSLSFNRSYGSFIGFILGTGTNTAYIEKNINILKNKNLDPTRSQIINIESGNFNKPPRSDLDLAFDNMTSDPGRYSFEKMFSGRYFGGLCLTVLKAASGEGVFSKQASLRIKSLTDLSTNDTNNFTLSQGNEKNILSECFMDSRDINNGIRIMDTLIERAAMLVAANLAAVVLKTGKGMSAEK